MTDRAWLDAYVAAWNARDEAGVLAYFHDDLTYNDRALGECFDRHSIVSFLKRNFEREDGLQFEITSACFGTDAVTWGWRMTGTGADGSAVDVPGMSWMEIADGLIRRNTDYWSRIKPPPR